MTNKERVLREYPSAWFNRASRSIEGYSQGLILGVGSVLARNLEASAWKDAAAKLRPVTLCERCARLKAKGKYQLPTGCIFCKRAKSLID
jgi:hypothetical protein